MRAWLDGVHLWASLRKDKWIRMQRKNNRRLHQNKIQSKSVKIALTIRSHSRPHPTERSPRRPQVREMQEEAPPAMRPQAAGKGCRPMHGVISRGGMAWGRLAFRIEHRLATGKRETQAAVSESRSHELCTACLFWATGLAAQCVYSRFCRPNAPNRRATSQIGTTTMAPRIRYCSSQSNVAKPRS